MNEPRRIAVGKFGRARGVQGEIFVVPYGDDPSRITRLKRASLEINGEFVEIGIERGALYSGKATVKISGYDNPEDVSHLTNRELYVTDDQLEALPENSFYVFELIGCEVVTESGDALGTVEDVENLPANDILVIHEAGQRYRLPIVKAFVKEVDVKNRRVVVNPPDGWREAQ